MVKALRSCLEAAKGENQGRSLDPQKKPQENSYRIFYSLKYIPYTHSTCRIYSLLVPGISREQLQDLLQPQIYPVYPFDMPDLQPASSGNMESRMSQETASYWQSPSGDCQLLAKSLFEGEIVPKLSPV